ncbi:putative manganese-dependent inorganic diphosphatase [Clostridium senegalense]|uniref:putative manganese-dependent inorganic diphosphatase n=1 Tax=Clostridium senegalense TaxID=1465809 RepID=UPI000288ADB5|nr:putative manganese-dependent inorganic diphosphatase [Clostridium senegalense]MBU5225360.1 putative manganese-dependent inorganic diphosphatase [Clostridium senegalense]
MKNSIYITGHKNPDSDSICSALAYAEFKNKTQKTPATAIRLGEINNETKFILDYFKVEQPKLITTVKTEIADLEIDTVAPISPDISLKMAWSIMKKINCNTLPVVDENERLIGITSVSNLTSSYLDIWDNYILAKSNTKLDNILDTLSARVEYLSDENLQLKGKIAVANMSPNDEKTIIEENDIVICGDREDIQNFVVSKKVDLMIITGNREPLPGIIEKAKEANCTIIVTPYDTFTTSRLITQSIPVSYVMTKNNLISFEVNDFIDEIKDIMLETRYRCYPVTDSNGKVIGTISRYHLINQRKKKVILMDHNEKSQSVDGIDDAEVVEIIDHHRIADIQTGLPIYFRNEPVGSTSTIVASIYFENGIRPSRQIAGILCGAIISDTLLLKSPTSTLVDEIVLKRLAQIADINIEEFANEMFKAATSLEGKSAKDLLNQDYKTFTIGETKIGVGQVTTTYIEGFKDIKNDLLELMETVASENNLEMITLMITDIFNGGSLFLVCGNKDLFISAFNTTLENNAVYLDGVVSRKKQVIPPLNEAIDKMN